MLTIPAVFGVLVYRGQADLMREERCPESASGGAVLSDGRTAVAGEAVPKEIKVQCTSDMACTGTGTPVSGASVPDSGRTRLYQT